MNELLKKYQSVGELKHIIFITLYATVLSPELKDSLQKSYELCLKEQYSVYEQVVKEDEGV